MYKKKVFVAFKYRDDDVLKLDGPWNKAGPPGYANCIAEYVLDDYDVYMSNHKDVDFRGLSYGQIEDYVAAKLRDTYLTIVLVSPNMRCPFKRECHQWIPWEIKGSLVERPREDLTTGKNAVLAVVLPDVNGEYLYFNEMDLFSIMDANISCGYIMVVNWSFFKIGAEFCISKALDRRIFTDGRLVSVKV